MAVRYKLTKINDNITGKEQIKYSVTTVSYGNVNLDTLAEQMADASTFTYGDVKGMIENLTLLISEALKGIGFKPSPKLKDRLSDIEFTRLK